MTSIARSALPLSGVRVVDFGQYIAGPAVAMILGDLGATVVHVDPPGGPLWDNPANAILNRNKLIVTLDLKSEEGVDEAKALVAEDENLPGVQRGRKPCRAGPDDHHVVLPGLGHQSSPV